MDSIEKAKARAILFLKFRPRTELELKARLSKLGYGFETVEQVLSEFKAKGLVNDEKFARYLAVKEMHSRPSGRRALQASLKAKGIPAEMALQAAEEAAEGKGDLEVARELARKKVSSFRGLAPGVVRRRLFGFLGRRGFPGDVVYKVVREVTGKDLGEVE